MKNSLKVLLLGVGIVAAVPTYAENIQEKIIPQIAGIQSKALLLGFAKNQYELGVAYYEGKLIPRNTAKAVEWLNRASEKTMHLQKSCWLG